MDRRNSSGLSKFKAFANSFRAMLLDQEFNKRNKRRFFVKKERAGYAAGAFGNSQSRWRQVQYKDKTGESATAYVK